MRDLIEMTYKCTSTPAIECHNCEYYKECLLSEFLDVHTGNAANNRISNTNTNYICWGRIKNEKDKVANILENGLDK